MTLKLLHIIVPNSLMFSPLFLMAMSHQTARQNPSANSRTGLVTLWGGGGGGGGERGERSRRGSREREKETKREEGGNANTERRKSYTNMSETREAIELQRFILPPYDNGGRANKNRCNNQWNSTTTHMQYTIRARNTNR